MNCHEFQSAIGAEPGSNDPQLLAHTEHCAACAQYRQEMLNMDRLIHRALSVPFEAESSGEPAQRPPARSRWFGWRMAASLLLSVTIAGSIWLAAAPESFAEQLVSHTHHEAFALVRTDERVDDETLDAILSKANIRLRTGASRVSYATTCPLRGHEVPHLVVQSESGPVTVLVLVHEQTATAMQRIEEDGYQGVIVPAPRGVLAVLGKDVPVQEAAEGLLRQVEYL